MIQIDEGELLFNIKKRKRQPHLKNFFLMFSRLQPTEIILIFVENFMFPSRINCRRRGKAPI